MAEHRCPVQGHDHMVIGIASHRQGGEGPFTADTFECPTGYYRWLVLRGRELSDVLRMKRPRFGWSRPLLPVYHPYTPAPEKLYTALRAFHYGNTTGEDWRFENITQAQLENVVKEGLLDAPSDASGMTIRILFQEGQ